MLFFLQDFSPSALLFSLGVFHIYWYGFFITLAFIVGYSGWKKTIIKTGGETRYIDSLCLWMVIGGVIGARLYHVVNEASWYSARPFEIIAIWHGGLAIHGALIGGCIAIIIACKKYHISIFSTVNTLIPWIAIGQAIGRWGNYFNQELYGKPSQLPWAIFIDPTHRVQGFEQSAYYHPVFLYESLLLALLGYVLLKIIIHKKVHYYGVAYYMIGSGVIRILMELIRIDSTPVMAGVRLPIIVSMGMIVIGCGWLFLKHMRRVVQ